MGPSVQAKKQAKKQAREQGERMTGRENEKSSKCTQKTKKGRAKGAGVRKRPGPGARPGLGSPSAVGPLLSSPFCSRALLLLVWGCRTLLARRLALNGARTKRIRAGELAAFWGILQYVFREHYRVTER